MGKSHNMEVQTAATGNQLVQVRASLYLLQGYDDYITARFLINNGFILQGTILASTAIEKYFKALLVGLKKPFKWIHLDKLTEIKKAFSDTEYSVLFAEYLDDVFLNMLGEAYRFRYLDGTKDTIQFGFLVNQFLAELDYTVNTIESLLIIEENGTRISHLRRDIEEKNPTLLKNNWLALGVPKAEFMNMETTAFGMYYDPKTSSPIIIQSKSLKPDIEYNGHILIITVNTNS
jgi:hypothetical protein